MGFLHLGWESATVEDDGGGPPLAELSPLWGVAAGAVDLARPGLPTVQRVLGWHPLHVAAMSGARHSRTCCELQAQRHTCKQCLQRRAAALPRRSRSPRPAPPLPFAGQAT